MEKDPSLVKIAFEKMNKSFNSIVEETVAKHGINRSEFFTLVCIVKKEAINIKAITNKLYYNKSQISRNIKVLIEKSLVEIIYKEGYKTKYDFVATSEGLNIYNLVRDAQEELKNVMFSRITSDEYIELIRILSKILA
jgi:DNA-binding MarR family transcriptional regulator